MVFPTTWSHEAETAASEEHLRRWSEVNPDASPDQRSVEARRYSEFLEVGQRELIASVDEVWLFAPTTIHGIDVGGGVRHTIPAGFHRVQRSLADNWWVKRHGGVLREPPPDAATLAARTKEQEDRRIEDEIQRRLTERLAQERNVPGLVSVNPGQNPTPVVGGPPGPGDPEDAAKTTGDTTAEDADVETARQAEATRQAEAAEAAKRTTTISTKGKTR